MKARSQFRQTVNGATKTVTLTSNHVGYEVKAWTYQIGDIKTQSEGDPYLHETFTEYDDAVNAFRLICHAAVDDPGAGFVKSGPMVSLDAQERIDDAVKMEHSDRERDRLGRIFDELKDGG